jgi:hypothetical protein
VLKGQIDHLLKRQIEEVDRLRQNSLTDDEKAVIVTSIQIMVVSLVLDLDIA